MGFVRVPGVDISDADAAVGEVVSGKTFYSVAVPKKTGTMPNVTLAHGSNAYPQGYHAGAANLLAIEPNLNSFNILSGVTIFGVNGNAGYLTPYLPEIIKARKSVSVKTSADKSIAKTAVPATSVVATYQDDLIDYIKQLTPAVVATKSLLSKAAPDQSVSKNASIGSELDWVIAAYQYEHPSGTITDETSQAQSGTANDIDLPSGAVDDACYFGTEDKAVRYWLNIGTAGAGNWTWVMEYWNGAWTAVVGGVDTTAQFMKTGILRIDHAPQIDWITTTINGIGPYYYTRIRITAFNNLTTVPKGTQLWAS